MICISNATPPQLHRLSSLRISSDELQLSSLDTIGLSDNPRVGKIPSPPTQHHVTITKQGELPLTPHDALTITSLDLASSTMLTDENVQKIAQDCKNLQKIIIRHAPNLSSQGIVSLSTINSLEHLELHLKKITDTDFQHISKLTHLRDLHVYAKNITGSGCHHLKALTQLQSLDLSHNTLTDGDMAFLPELPLLQKLHIHFCELLTGDALRHISPLPNLTYLNLTGTNITDQGLKHLSPPQLSELVLGSNKLTNQALAVIKETCPMLQSLTLMNYEKIDDDGLEHVQDMKHLTTLDLSNCGKIKDDGLKHIQNMKQLTALDLGNCPISDQGLNYITSVRTLERLSLLGTEITDEGLKNLQPLINLKALLLPFTDVSNSGVQSISSLGKLKYLDLGNCEKITAEALKNMFHQTVHVNIGDY